MAHVAEKCQEKNEYSWRKDSSKDAEKFQEITCLEGKAKCSQTEVVKT